MSLGHWSVSKPHVNRRMKKMKDRTWSETDFFREVIPHVFASITSSLLRTPSSYKYSHINTTTSLKSKGGVLLLKQDSD